MWISLSGRVSLLFVTGFLGSVVVVVVQATCLLVVAMAEHPDHDHVHEEPKGGESLLDKISEKIHAHDSSSDSDDDKGSASASMKSKIYRLFGREKPVHKVFGGGKRKCF